MRTIMDVEGDLYFARGYFSATGDPSDGQVVERYEQELRKLELLQCLEFNRSYREQYVDEIEEYLQEKYTQLRQLWILAENNPHLYQEDIEHLKTEIMINGGDL